MTLDDLIGKRFHDHRNDEGFTVLDVQEINGELMFVVMQYDDGVPWDEAIANEEIAEQIGWSAYGLLSEDYELVGPGPKLADACEDHDWFPTPDQLWDTAEQYDSHLYNKIVRCKRCGLSGSTVLEHGAGTVAPTMCVVFDSAKSDTKVSYSTKEYRDYPVCRSCIDEEGLQESELIWS